MRSPVLPVMRGRGTVMLSATIADKTAASSWIDGHAIPQDLIEGVITTFIGLLTSIGQVV
jgi:hypothetical protein